MYHMKLYLKNSGSNQRKTQTTPDDCCLSLVVIWVQIFKTENTIKIQLVRLTEVCGKVLSEKNAYKSVKTAFYCPLLLIRTTKTAVCLQTKAMFHYHYGF